MRAGKRDDALLHDLAHGHARRARERFEERLCLFIEPNAACSHVIPTYYVVHRFATGAAVYSPSMRCAQALVCALVTACGGTVEIVDASAAADVSRDRGTADRTSSTFDCGGAWFGHDGRGTGRLWLLRVAERRGDGDDLRGVDDLRRMKGAVGRMRGTVG